MAVNSKQTLQAWRPERATPWEVAVPVICRSRWQAPLSVKRGGPRSQVLA